MHRMQLQHFGELVKAATLEGSNFLEYDTHPLDTLYTIDADLIMRTRQTGVLNNDLHALMLDTAREQRRIFAWARETEVMEFIEAALRGDAQDFPHPLEQRSHRSAYTGLKPRSVELLPVSGAAEAMELNCRDYTYDVFLPALKARAIDPPYLTEGGHVVRLSEQDQDYARMLQQCRAIQRQAYVARVHMAPDAVLSLRDKLAQVGASWDEAFRAERRPASHANLLENLRTIGSFAITQSPNQIRLR